VGGRLPAALSTGIWRRREPQRSADRWQVSFLITSASSTPADLQKLTTDSPEVGRSSRPSGHPAIRPSTSRSAPLPFVTLSFITSVFRPLYPFVASPRAYRRAHHTIDSASALPVPRAHPRRVRLPRTFDTGAAARHRRARLLHTFDAFARVPMPLEPSPGSTDIIDKQQRGR